MNEISLRSIDGEQVEVREPDPLPTSAPGVPKPHPTEEPRPLTRDFGCADPFPVKSLGPLLAQAALAINERIQAPLAICGQSVLAAATLVVQGHANVELPTRQHRPVTNFFLTVAGTGERKSAVDALALSAVCKREVVLRNSYQCDRQEYEKSQLAWEKARDAACKIGKGDRARIKAALDDLGPAPIGPLEPLLICPEPTYEGLCRLLLQGQPSVGIFASEGGQFIGGPGMSDESKLRTASGLSAVWDGDPIKRVRAGEGITILPGRRVTMHLMAQPDVAAILLGDRLMTSQGLLSRCLPTAPDAASGTRRWQERSTQGQLSLDKYDSRLLEILEAPLPLAPGRSNELIPRVLRLSESARRLWIGFYEHVESRLRSGGELEPVVGLANKLPEHAARLAAVITLIKDIYAAEIGSEEMSSGVKLAQHFASEGLRLVGAGQMSEKLREAKLLLAWLMNRTELKIALTEIYQRGPNSMRDAESARRAAKILVEHGWLTPDLTSAREVWRIVRMG